MKKTVEEKTISNNKKVSVTTQSYTEQIEVNNQIKNDVYDSITEKQYDKFVSLFPENVRTTGGLPQTYLSAYKELIKTFIFSYNNSVYTKTKEQLGTTFSGAALLQNTDFFKLIDVQGVKDALNKKMQDNPCMVLDTESNPQTHPLKIEMIREAFLLSARAHIVDYSLRNILITSVFDNTNFYLKDSSYADFVFESYIQRIQAYPKYYDSLVFYLQIDLDTALSSGTTFVDPITNQPIEFVTPLPEEKEQINAVILEYMRFLVNQEMLNIANTFNAFFARSLTQNGTTIDLSPQFDAQQYILDSFDIVDISNINRELNRKSVGEFFFLLDRNNGFFCIKRNQTKYERIISLGTITAVNNSLLAGFRQSLVATQQYDLLFNYCFNINKALNFASIYNILMCSRLYEQTNMAFEPCIITAQSIHSDILSDTDKGQKLECEEIDVNFQTGLNAEIAKIIAQTPLTIIKSLEEAFDPNIRLAKTLKSGAEALGSPDLSIIPYSAYLMVPPPFGPAIPVIPPWGFVYWGISAAEAIQNSSKSAGGVGFGNLGVDVSGSFDIKNPFKPNC